MPKVWKCHVYEDVDDYDQLDRYLTRVMYIPDLTLFIIAKYMCDFVNFRTLPLSVQKAVEKHHCQVVKTAEGYKRLLFGYRHSVDDLPSEQTKYCRMWHKDGQLHRDNGKPAFINIVIPPHFHPFNSNWDLMVANFPIEQEWWVNGVKHRDNDLPAVDCPNLKEWYKHGLRHRDGFQPAVIADIGNIGKVEYYVEGKYKKLIKPMTYA